MQIISFMNAKGGVAKTTSALCLAQYLASKEYKTLFVDLDPQANATKTLLGLNVGEDIEGVTLYNVIYEWVIESKREIPAGAVRSVEEHMDLLPAHKDLEPFKDYAKTKMRNPLRLMSSILKKLERDYDYCVIDCPADLSVYVESSIYASNLIIIPSQYDAFGFEGVSIVFQAIQEIDEDGEIPRKVLYTMHNKQATKIKEDMGDYEVFLRDFELPFRVPIDQQVRNAQGKKQSLMSHKDYKNSSARLAYKKLGEYVIEEAYHG